VDVTLAKHLFSGDRLEPYFNATNSDLAAALELYRWNVELSAAYFELLA